jgi:hypothetical protein
MSSRPDHDHTRARDHDVARLHVGDLEDALDHGERIVAEQFAPLGVAQQRQQLVAVARFPAQRLGQARKQ